MPVRYLLWDHDGVLVDTERWYFAATQSILASVGVELTAARYLEYMADGRSSWGLAAAAGVSDAVLRDLRTRRDALYQQHLQSKPIEISGVAETLRVLNSQYRMGIVTTARRTDFDIIHAQRDLTRSFEFVLTLEDYERCKPAPDPYLAGMARFGADPREVVAIEDSARGLRSAVGAGCRCVVVENEFTKSQDFAGAARVVGSVVELPAVLREMDEAA